MSTTDEKNQKMSLPDIKNLAAGLRAKNWIFTISFFFVAFLAAVYVWWSCVQTDIPRPAVVTAFNQSKEDFDQMSRKVSGAIKQLQQRKEEFEQAKDYSVQRELFRDWQGGSTMEPSEGESGGADQKPQESKKVDKKDTSSTVVKNTEPAENTNQPDPGKSPDGTGGKEPAGSLVQ